MDEKVYISNRARNLIVIALGSIYIAFCIYSVFAAINWVDRPFPGFWVLKNTTVASHFSGQLIGYEKGIKYADIVNEINDKPVSSYDEIMDFILKQKPGTIVKYKVQRLVKDEETGKNIIGQAIFEVPILSFSLSESLQFFLFPKFSGLMFYFIGLIVFYLRPNARTSWVFLFFGIIVGFTIASVPEYRTNNFNPLLTSLALVGPCFMLISLYFPTQLKSHKYFLAYLAVTALPLAFLFNFYFDNRKAFLIIAFIVMSNFGLTGLAGIIMMVRSFVKSKDPLVRQKGKIVVYGFLVASTGSAIIIFGLFMVNLYNVYTLYFIHFSMALIPLSLGYAIVKHNLFDVDVVIRRTLVYLLVSGIVVLSFFGLITLFSLLFQKISGQSSQIAAILSTLFMVALFRPLRERVDKVINRRFYRERYEYQATIHKASNILISIIELDKLLNQLLDTVIDAIKIERGCILLKGKNPEGFKVAVTRGYDDDGEPEFMEPDDPLVIQLELSPKPVQLNDIEELDGFREAREPLLRTMKNMRVVLVIPIIYESRLMGMLCLGEKKSGAWYSSEDMNLLHTLMIQTAVSIENACKVEELKQMVELETSYRELKRLDELKDNFLSMVSHDLRTPMVSIVGYSSILLEKLGKLDEERQKKYLNTIVREGGRLTQLINDLLDLQRFEAGRMSLDFQDFEMVKLVGEAVELFQGAAQQKEIKLDSELPDEEVIIYGHPNRISQVVGNLLSNAIKFTPEGGTVNTRAEIIKENGKRAIKVSVSDTGPGIPKEYQATLFDRFMQVDKLVREKEQGSGLGLALVKEIVEHHNGRVGMKSEPGAGSTFYFIIGVKE